MQVTPYPPGFAIATSACTPIASHRDEVGEAGRRKSRRLAERPFRQGRVRARAESTSAAIGSPARRQRIRVGARSAVCAPRTLCHPTQHDAPRTGRSSRYDDRDTSTMPFTNECGVPDDGGDAGCGTCQIGDRALDLAVAILLSADVRTSTTGRRRARAPRTSLPTSARAVEAQALDVHGMVRGLSGVANPMIPSRTPSRSTIV